MEVLKQQHGCSFVINMKKKKIYMAPGMRCRAKICIGSCDYYDCLALWKLIVQDYLVLRPASWVALYRSSSVTLTE